MDFQQLLAKMVELDTPVAETAVETPVAECPADMSNVGTPVAPTVPEAAPSMSVNMNAQGLDNISDLIKLIAKADETSTELPQIPPATPELPTDLPVPADLSSMDLDDDSEKKDEWANEPDEEVSDVDNILIKGNDLHKSKKTFPKVAGGDNPMAMEGEELRAWVKNELSQRLAEIKGAE